MQIPKSLSRVAIIFATLCSIAVAVCGQQSQNQDPDVIRVNTSLVQTDVMVFDKNGKFIDNLKRDQFVLKIDGKPRDVSFFEIVKAGSPNEESQLAAARGVSSKAGTPRPLDRGRSVFFFLDDFHMSEDSAHQTKKVLSEFIERQMGQNDQVAIVSTSGQIGFLQQLTDNKRVLLKAIERVRARPYKTHDITYPPKSEYQALRIDIGDRDVLGVFVDAMLRENSMLTRGQVEDEVRNRATSMLRMSANGTRTTFSSLQWVMDKFRAAPGRKIMFFLSDGFTLDVRNSDTYARLRDLTSLAGASTFVIYSIDSRGLSTGQADAGTPVVSDLTGRISRGTMGELPASQDGLNALAVDTGGKAFFNSNNLSAAVNTALDDASIYYLLAWRPEANEERNPKQRRLEISVVGRPDLIVRSRTVTGEPVAEPAKNKPSNSASQPNQNTEVRSALQAIYPKSGFPVEATLNFVNTAQRGDVLITSIRMSPTALNFDKTAAVPTASILLSGLVLDEDGKVVDQFNKRLTVSPKSGEDGKSPRAILYTGFSAVKPGLYQVRVVAADEKGGPTGGVWDWIEIPEFSPKNFALSSLMVGERATEPVTDAGQTSETKSDPTLSQVSVNITRRFASSSYLRFMTVIYNAATGPAATGNTPGGKPDLAVQVQVFRDNEPVITDPVHQISTEGATDLTRISYAAELKLEGLAPGRYVLQLTVIDRIAKASASQRFRFQVD